MIFTRHLAIAPRIHLLYFKTILIAVLIYYIYDSLIESFAGLVLKNYTLFPKSDIPLKSFIFDNLVGSKFSQISGVILCSNKFLAFFFALFPWIEFRTLLFDYIPALLINQSSYKFANIH